MSGTQILPNEGPRRKREDTTELDAALREIVANGARVESIEEAIAATLERLDEMPHLNAWFREQAAAAMIYDARSRLRERMVVQAAWTLPERAATMSDARLNARISLYDWPLPGTDVRLGNATADDLETAAAYHEGRAAHEAQRAGVYRQIGNMLRAARKKTVRQGVPELKLAEVMRGAQ